MPDATLEAVGFIGSVRCVDGLALSPRYEVVAFDTEDGAEIARVPVDGAGQFTLRCATDPDLRGMAATLSVRTPSGKIAAEQVVALPPPGEVTKVAILITESPEPR